MKKGLLLILALIAISVTAQVPSGINVRLLNKKTKESIPFAVVTTYDNGKHGKAYETNIEGQTKLLDVKSKVIIVSAYCYGFKTTDTIISITQDTIKLYMNPVKELGYKEIYNKDSAYSDLKRGQIKILFIGLVSNEELKKLNICCEKYGFKYVFTTDVINWERGDIYAAVNEYNATVMNYLKLVNKDGWIDELKQKCGINLK